MGRVVGAGWLRLRWALWELLLVASPLRRDGLRAVIWRTATQYGERMDKPLGEDDFAAMEGQLRGCVEAERHYWRVNDVKCDAIHTAKTYEEFADRVAAAHLRPLEKADFKQKAPRGWNQYAAKDSAKWAKNDRDYVD